MLTRRSKLWRWAFHKRYTIGGTILLLVGIGVAAQLAFVASGKTPPSGSESAIYVFVAGLIQVASAWLFSRGRPGAAEVRFLLQRHARINEQLAQVKVIVEYAVDDGSAPVAKAAMQQLTIRVSQVEADHLELANNWLKANSSLLEHGEGLDGQ